eukprot:CAMPEP_0172160624 /NCGR_PEP_ID=MMETSP1050-20130122/5660_1 /TAXON_ID=233186 /ORGANISM="Cryptomonas curvata, Strain CCAP979/52" /LENGTH=223 /DNA_ID=CAMNT_0012830405 /DNA_START=57 /DNA_END=724 /DNA_ORIENTATION=-
MEEYDRLEREEKEHGRILVAQRVPLEKWRKSKIPSSIGQVVIEADFGDIEVTKKTKADLFIAKLPGLAHDCGLGDITFQLGVYKEATGDLFSVGGGNIHLPGRDRCPDTALRPYVLAGENPLMPRLIGEIEITHRGVHEILLYNAQLFAGIPQLRATVFLKVYSRDAASRRFGALALLFRRLPGGVVCADAVSCGTAPLQATVVRSLPPAIGGILRHLGIPPA